MGMEFKKHEAISGGQDERFKTSIKCLDTTLENSTFTFKIPFKICRKLSNYSDIQVTIFLIILPAH